MSNAKPYEGYLISELGVKRYLDGRRDQQFSNINLFQDVQKITGSGERILVLVAMAHLIEPCVNKPPGTIQ